jgi:glycosyltransferase involved in cell wall biosynthesis
MDVTILNPIAATPNLTAASLLRPSVPNAAPSVGALKDLNIVQLGEAIAGLGHRVRVVLGSPFLGETAIPLSDRLSAVPVHTVMPIPFHPGLIPMTPELLRHAAIRESDVIQSSEFHQPSTFFAAEVSLEDGTPLVVWQETFRPMRFPGSIYQRGFEAVLGPKVRAAAVGCVPRTSRARGYLQRLGVRDEAIRDWVPTGVNLANFAPRATPLSPSIYGWEDGCEILVLVARLVSGKGVDVALRMLRTLLASRPNARLLIAGGGPEENTLRHLADELSLTPCVRFLPKMNQTEMADLYNVADIVLSTSRNDLLPISLMEASACGRTIVAMDAGAVTDIVINGVTGRVVPAGAERELVEAVATLLRQEEDRLTLGRAARARAEQYFDLRLCARRLNEVYLHAAA